MACSDGKERSSLCISSVVSCLNGGVCRYDMCSKDRCTGNVVVGGVVVVVVVVVVSVCTWRLGVHNETWKKDDMP